MGCCNEPSVALPQAGQNPAQHVNYTKGMVLGVDDFTQEFTYLANRDQWAIRELLGYGTISGLAITIDDAGVDDGPRLHVTRGTAAVPSGKLVCVPEEQCALINKWLAKAENKDKINKLIADTLPPLPPPVTKFKLSLYLVLCYQDCKTMPVPIPGDPCRSDDQLMADSRIADDYCLELRTEAPSQIEEDALRDFVAWLKQMPLIDTGSADEEKWINALKTAVRLSLDTMKNSPAPFSSSVLFEKLRAYLFDTVATTKLEIPREHVSSFLRVAFRFWVTNLKPIWASCSCNTIANPSQDCVLLAQLEVPIISVDGVWIVNDKAVNGEFKNIHIDESRRPYLASMRLLQEWLLCGFASDPSNPVTLPQSLTKISKPSFNGITTTGGVQIAIKTVNADLTLDATHHCVICNGDITITLPKCAPSNQGRVYIIKSQKETTRVHSATGDTIDGLEHKTLGIHRSFTLVSDGIQTWHIIETS